MVMTQPTQTVQKRLGFSWGNVLLHLSGHYPGLQDAIAESVQNSIDAKAKMIDCMLDLGTKTYSQRDDGVGASVEEMDSRLVTIAQPERKGKSSLGQYSIGFFSFFGK